jgi:hypothetical protein
MTYSVRTAKNVVCGRLALAVAHVSILDYSWLPAALSGH